MKYAVSDLDIFYISYDEPRASDHYRDLCKKARRPVKRVHGVKGFHQAHKICAEMSETSRFVTVDGDNIVHESLFDQLVDDDAGKDLVFSFKARNVINGLEYGNGGVKVWPKGLVLNVPTHEDSTDETGSTDFCWVYRYMQVNHLASTVHCNQSALQSFRSGYREGVKMTLIGGRKLETWNETRPQIYQGNWSRLMIWATVGADQENGWWAIYGTRKALADAWIADAPTFVQDYDWFESYFETVKDRDPKAESLRLAIDLNADLSMGLVNLDEDQSRWFKSTYINPERSGIMIPDMKPVEFDD